MIRYSHISLMVLCEAAEAAEINAFLGVEPSEVRESRIRKHKPDGSFEEIVHFQWTLNSPKSWEDGDPTTRLLGTR